MNYLAHFVFNHDVRGLPAEPYFAMGVALPDLWLRYSRRRRLRWRAVRTAVPHDPRDAQLRAGLLNHVEADRRFHVLPAFLRWQRQLKQAVDGEGVHPALLDFLAHLAIELTLDQRLLHADPGLLDRYSRVLLRCDAREVAERAGRLGDVETPGLDEIVTRFQTGRFMDRYRTLAGLQGVVARVLELAQIPMPDERVRTALLMQATQIVDPERVWRELGAGQAGRGVGAGPVARRAP